MGICQSCENSFADFQGLKKLELVCIDIIEWNVLPLAFRQNILHLDLYNHYKTEYCDHVYIYIPAHWDENTKNIILKTVGRTRTKERWTAKNKYNFLPPNNFFDYIEN